MNVNNPYSGQQDSTPTQVFTEEQRQAIANAFNADKPETTRRGKPDFHYVREQKGHSLTKHLLLGWVVLWIPAIYYTFSPNHYWKF